MHTEQLPRDNRRSTRIRMKVHIAAQSVSEPLACEGDTIIVNLHGALIATTIPLRVSMRIDIHVISTDKHAHAQVVYIDPDHPRLCGISLETPENIWGVSLPPDDWSEGASQ